MFIFYIRCFFKTFITLQSNSRNTVHFKTMAYCVCAECGTVWSGFGGVSVQQVALWWVCVLASFELYYRNLNVFCFMNHPLVS